jgi:hypothetical protein
MVTDCHGVDRSDPSLTDDFVKEMWGTLSCLKNLRELHLSMDINNGYDFNESFSDGADRIEYQLAVEQFADSCGGTLQSLALEHVGPIAFTSSLASKLLHLRRLELNLSVTAGGFSTLANADAICVMHAHMPNLRALQIEDDDVGDGVNMFTMDHLAAVACWIEADGSCLDYFAARVRLLGRGLQETFQPRYSVKLGV